MKISSRSFWYRLAYGDRKVSHISLCNFADSLLTKSVLYATLGVILTAAALIMLCISTVAIPIALLFGERPCFIKFWRSHLEKDSAFERYPTLMATENWRMLPIGPCLLIVTAYLMLSYGNQNTSNTIFAWTLAGLGASLLLLTILRQFKIWDTLLRVVELIQAKACIPIEVTE